MIFSTVFGPHEPAFTVGSFAISATGRPPTVAMPVTTPSAPKPSCSQFASSASSTNESGVDEPRDALAHGQLALVTRLLVVALGPAPARAVERVLQVRHGAGTYQRAARSCERSARRISCSRPRRTQ